MSQQRFFVCRMDPTNGRFNPVFTFFSASTDLDGELWSVRLSDYERNESGWFMRAEFLIPQKLQIGDSFRVRVGSSQIGVCTVVSIGTS